MVEILPVVHGEDRHRGVEAGVCERQRLGACAHHGAAIATALRDHRTRRLDRDDLAPARLVRSGSRADVADAPRVAERGFDLRGDACVGHATNHVAVSDPIVECPGATAA